MPALQTNHDGAVVGRRRGRSRIWTKLTIAGVSLSFGFNARGFDRAVFWGWRHEGNRKRADEVEARPVAFHAAPTFVK